MRSSSVVLPGLTSFKCLCPSDYFDDIPPNSKCLICNYSCFQCKGASSAECTSCGDYSFTRRNYTQVDNIQNVGTCTCDSGFRDDGVDLQCRTCPYRCSTCDNMENCLSCPPTRYYLSYQIVFYYVKYVFYSQQQQKEIYPTMIVHAKLAYSRVEYLFAQDAALSAIVV